MKKNEKQITVAKGRLFPAFLGLIITVVCFYQALCSAAEGYWGSLNSMEKWIYIFGAVSFVLFFSYIIDYVCVNKKDKSERKCRIFLSLVGAFFYTAAVLFSNSFFNYYAWGDIENKEELFWIFLRQALRYIVRWKTVEYQICFVVLFAVLMMITSSRWKAFYKKYIVEFWDRIFSAITVDEDELDRECQKCRFKDYCCMEVFDNLRPFCQEDPKDWFGDLGKKAILLSVTNKEEFKKETGWNEFYNENQIVLKNIIVSPSIDYLIGYISSFHMILVKVDKVDFGQATGEFLDFVGLTTIFSNVIPSAIEWNEDKKEVRIEWRELERWNRANITLSLEKNKGREADSANKTL